MKSELKMNSMLILKRLMESIGHHIRKIERETERERERESTNKRDLIDRLIVVVVVVHLLEWLKKMFRH